MKVLLTKPKISNYPLGYDLYSPMIPMGLGFLANSLERAGHTYRIVDNYLSSYKKQHWDEAAFVNDLKTFDPDYVGISIISLEFKEAQELINIVRFNSDAKIIAGGPLPTLFPESILPFVDYVVVGEGEQAIIDIIEQNINYKYRNNKLIFYPFIKNLDEFFISDKKYRPLIPWDHFDIPAYSTNMKIEQWGLKSRPIVNLNTSRGCPFKCKFCSIVEYWGKGGYRFISSRRIVDEIKYIYKKYGIRSLIFREDNFMASRERIQKFCELLRRTDVGIEWAAEARVDSINKELIMLMSKSGCKGLLLGVESGSERMLQKMRKEITIEIIKKAFNICKNNGIKTFATVMYGLPEETEKDREATELLLDEIDPDFVEASVYLGIPGSEFFHELKEKEEYEFFDKSTAHIYPTGYKELVKRYVPEFEKYIPY